MADKRPNILVFFTDQQRWDTCGCYGQPLPITPNLDAMADQGVRFSHAFTCQPLCGPVRATLQTGRYPTEVGCPVNHRALPPDIPTVARVLRSAGYETGYLGKWHLASFGPSGGADDFCIRAVPSQRRGGYDDFWLAADALEHTSHSYDGHMFDADGNMRHFPAGRYRADVQTDWLLEYLETRRLDRPFFLFCSYLEPHHQNDHGHYEGPAGSRERFADFVVPGDLAGTEGDWRAEYPDYLGCCHALDANLSRVRQKLADLGLLENTLVIYTSDHGTHFRTRNGEYKRSCHENSIRVPMVFSGPGFTGGCVIDRLVGLIDVPPTIVKAAGLTPPEFMRGRPLQTLLSDAPADWRDEIFVQISESQTGRALRTPRWKYSVRDPHAPKGAHNPGSLHYVEECLYDLESDPHERNNLVAEPALSEIRNELRERLIRRMVEIGEPEPTISPASS